MEAAPDPRHAELFTRIEAALDGYETQHSTEAAPGEWAGCVRCSATPADGSEFCGPCRAYLLGDSDDAPPALRCASWTPPGGSSLLESLRAGRLHLLTEGGQAVTGEEAVDLVMAGGRRFGPSPSWRT